MSIGESLSEDSDTSLQSTTANDNNSPGVFLTQVSQHIASAKYFPKNIKLSKSQHLLIHKTKSIICMRGHIKVVLISLSYCIELNF